MRSLGLFSQIGAVGLALIIAYFYVQPTVAEIGETQTETARYETERVKIEAINAQLSGYLATLESIQRTDRERLATYMPQEIDDINIMRDITFIAEEVPVVSSNLTYNGQAQGNNTVFSGNDTGSSLGGLAASPHLFSLSIEGSYEGIKDFLRLLELNEYPLEVHQMSLSSSENNESVDTDDNRQMTAEMTLVTYVNDLVLVNDN